MLAVSGLAFLLVVAIFVASFVLVILFLVLFLYRSTVLCESAD